MTPMLLSLLHAYVKELGMGNSVTGKKRRKDDWAPITPPECTAQCTEKMQTKNCDSCLKRHCLKLKSRVSYNRVKFPSNPPKQITPERIHNCTILSENRPRRSNCTICKRIVCKGEGAGALGCSESKVGRSRSLTNLEKLSATCNKQKHRHGTPVQSCQTAGLRCGPCFQFSASYRFSLTSNPHHFRTSTFCAPDSAQGQHIFSAFQLILRELPQRFRTSIFSDISLRRWTLIFQVQRANQPTLFQQINGEISSFQSPH